MPRPGSPIVHPDILAATGRFEATCDVQRATISYDAEGQESYSWATVFADVPAAWSTNSPGGGSGGAGRGERRRSFDEIVQYPYTIELSGVYAATPKDRAIFDGTTYEVMAVEHDSQGIFTRILCEIVE